jgi:hypothetical protein
MLGVASSANSSAILHSESTEICNLTYFYGYKTLLFTLCKEHVRMLEKRELREIF